jgi:hypothetical protein
VSRLLVTVSVVPSSPILVTLLKEALLSSETSVLTRAIRRNIPEATILLYTYRIQDRKFCITLGFEVLTTEALNVAIICDMTPCSLHMYPDFEKMFNVLLQCRKSTKNKLEPAAAFNFLLN